MFPCKGSAYAFYSADGVSGWSEVSKLLASDGATDDFFGSSVSVWSNVIVAGAYGDDTSAGVDAGERAADIILNVIIHELSYLGSAYVFSSVDGVSGWSQRSKLLASDGAASDRFGSSVSVWSNVIVVGAYGDDILSSNQGERAIFVLLYYYIIH